VTQVRYYRTGSAASMLSPAHVPDAALDGIELVHLTGITMGLSASARELVVDLARRARAHGATVLFDPNWRPSLWPSVGDAEAAFAAVLQHADWVLCGAAEAALLFGQEEPGGAIAELRRRGAGGAVVRIGRAGAVVHTAGGPVTVAPPRMVDVVDEVGAGDAFAAGFACGLLRGEDAVGATRLAHRLAGAALSGSGDWETLPRLEDLERELR
jgi:sugar/nucleoside kinase (ribokinase family)